MGYRSENAATISKAFKRFARNEDATIREGMYNAARAGMDYLIEAHNAFKPGLQHTKENDTLAYAVAHDGTVQMMGFHSGGEGKTGWARNAAASALSGTTGWVAIVLSEMHGWYKVSYEVNFLSYSAAEIKSNFSKFFKRVR